jgi:hypothetical protein
MKVMDVNSWKGLALNWEARSDLAETAETHKGLYG